MKKLILIIAVLTLIVPSKGYCIGELMLVPSIFNGIKLIGSLFAGKQGDAEDKKTAIAQKDQVEYAKEQAVERMGLKNKQITFGNKFDETVINYQSTVMTYYGTVNGKDTLISLGFKRSGDTLYRSVIVWDSADEFKVNCSKEQLVKVFAATVNFGQIEDVSMTAHDKLRELAKLHKDNIISDTEFETKRKEILSRI